MLIHLSDDGDTPKKIIVKKLTEPGDHDELNHEDNLFFIHKAHHKKPNKAKLGVTISDTDEGGAYVGSVLEGSGAALAGIQEGDIIIQLGTTPVESVDALIEKMSEFEPNHIVDVAFLRDGSENSVQVTLGENEIHSDDIHIEMDDCHTGYGWIFDTKNNNRHCTIIIRESKSEEEEIVIEEIIEEELEDFDIEVPSNTLELEEFKVYPNPSVDNGIRIEFSGNEGPLTVQITDLSGRTLFREDISDFDGDYSNLVRLESDVSGVLLVTIIQNDKIYTEKLIIK